MARWIDRRDKLCLLGEERIDHVSVANVVEQDTFRVREDLRRPSDEPDVVVPVHLPFGLLEHVDPLEHPVGARLHLLGATLVAGHDLV